MSKKNRVYVDRDPLLRKFGKRMESLRENNDDFERLDDFCYVSRLSRSQVDDYEKGKTEPGLVNLQRICDALGVTIPEFFSEGFEDEE